MTYTGLSGGTEIVPARVRSAGAENTLCLHSSIVSDCLSGSRSHSLFETHRATRDVLHVLLLIIAGQVLLRSTFIAVIPPWWYTVARLRSDLAHGELGRNFTTEGALGSPSMQLFLNLDSFHLVRVISQFYIRLHDLLFLLFLAKVSVFGDLQILHLDVPEGCVNWHLLVIVQTQFRVLPLALSRLDKRRLVFNQVTAHDVAWVACTIADWLGTLFK